MICSIEGCERPANRVKYGWCETHYYRWRRHGDPTFLLADHGSVSSAGYRRVRSQYEHRRVLMDRLGPGWQHCHWCDVPLSWEPVPGHYQLEADHLDGDKLNNDPANLVPSCHPCNSARAARSCAPGCTCGRHGRVTAAHRRAG